MIYPIGQVLFSCGFFDDDSKADEDFAIKEAKIYINKFGLTSDDVSIIKQDGQVFVRAKKPIELMEKQDETF